MYKIIGKVTLGTGSVVDDEAIIGYKTSRYDREETLVIGKDARIRAFSVIYSGTVIGDNLQTGHGVVIREENQIGDNVQIWANSVIDYGCKLGSNIKIHSMVYVAQKTIIEDNVFLAPGVMIANDKYPLSHILEGPHIKKGTRIGINSTIMPAVTIGENVLIGAGSLVTKDIPDNCTAYGVPARVVKRQS
jgi:acetyltransferase-like isoleucine patch superfamily enzyme